MARRWFSAHNCPLAARDLMILNRATRHLIDDHNMAPSHRWLSSVRQLYKPGMNARQLVDAVNHERSLLHDIRE